jgi:hypothetical protein
MNLVGGDAEAKSSFFKQQKFTGHGAFGFPKPVPTISSQVEDRGQTLSGRPPSTPCCRLSDYKSPPRSTHAGPVDIPGKATAAGTAYDVNDDPITGAQVVVKSLVDDSIPDGIVVKYFVDSFPNRSQPETSPDGLWVAINIPPGDWKVEMWVSDGAGGHLLMGQSKLTVFPDSINISNIYTGYDSVKYPASCFASR